MLFGSLRGKTTSMTLADAARRALETARRERLPLLSVAERKGRAESWFAANMLDVVTIQGRRPDATRSEALTKDLRADLVLTEDMGGLKAADEDRPRYVELTVAVGELNRYLRWARTVQ